MRPLRTFYGKLAALFLVLMLVTGAAQLALNLWSYRQFERESHQSLNRRLAADLAVRFRPFLADRLDRDGIGHTFHELMVMNPYVEIYLLDARGEVLAYFADPEKIRRLHVDLDPVRRFLAGGGSATLPLYGDDPRSDTGRKPFSAVAVDIGGVGPGYLYVILGGQEYESAAAMFRDSYIVRTAAGSALLLFGSTVAVGLLAFFLLTRRLRRLTDVVRRFRAGDWQRRAAPGPADEVGELSVAFNEMADTLVANLEALERNDRLRRELVASVSHDLRSPLTAVRGYLDTIQMRQADLAPDRLRRYLDTVSRNVAFLGKLVNDLFDLSKLEAGQMKPALEAFSAVELVHDVVMKHQVTAAERQVHLAAAPPVDLPLVEADISMIERTLDNLIDNALRHTPPGGQVQVGLQGHGDGVTIAVTDTGQGIDAADLPHIFERFYRVGDHSKEGTGLGLAIAQKIVAAHGARLEVDSAPGEGATFRFSLALAPM